MRCQVVGVALILAGAAGTAVAAPVKCIDFQARLEAAARAAEVNWPPLQWKGRDGVVAITNLPDVDAFYLCSEGRVLMFSTTREVSKGASLDFGSLQTAAIVGIGAFDDWRQALSYQQRLLIERAESVSQQMAAGKLQPRTKQTINGYDVKFGASNGVRFFTLEQPD
ncbi:hypothetical protein [Labrys sp. 22185]|uniref:hypothetical protein n=1 Tax=Labrys sp. 22185 TaxID=3453888 RepID=UPI003F87AF97